MSTSDNVREFHEAFGLPIRKTPGLPGVRERLLRFDLLQEEFREYDRADGRGDLVEMADALADMVYVIYGTALAYGINLDAVLEEVHRSNMSKLGPDGEPIFRDDGKVLKGPNFFPPNIEAVWDEK